MKMMNYAACIVGSMPRPARAAIKKIISMVGAFTGMFARRRVDVFWANVLNFGDLLTPSLLKSFGLVSHYVDIDILGEDSLVGCGSILGWLKPQFKGYILGTGLMTAEEAKPLAFARFLAVRGDMTRNAMGLDNKVVLCDPGLLAGRLLEGPVQKRWRFGIVPHQLDLNSKNFCNMMASLDREKHGLVHVISSRQLPDQVVKEIASCEYIISSSLHGIIVADSLGVPSVRVRFDAKIDDFKFADYYSSIGMDFIKPYGCTECLDLDSLVNHMRLLDNSTLDEKINEIEKCFYAYFYALNMDIKK